MPAPTAADLIFSSEQANHNFSKTLGDLKRSTLSIHNRLQSVLRDAEFAQLVADAYGRPLIANERCGSWYIDPKTKKGSAYFKSTDGHNGVWGFSSRRLNLQLLEIAGQNDGCIIVDSTRRGKSMPDALSKTIPIWCSVLNRFLFPTKPQFHDLYTPPQVVSQSEHEQISALLPSFVKTLRDLHLQPEALVKNISKPLRPIWVTPDSHIEAVSTIFDDFHPIVCCTVSKRVVGGELSEGGYIQGAGDDTENWAHGLTPTIFWENQQTLLSAMEADLPDTIGTLVRQQVLSESPRENLKCVAPTSSLFITKISNLPVMSEEERATAIVIVLRPEVSDESTWLTSPNRIDVGVGPHKIGMKRLRNALPFIMKFLTTNQKNDQIPETELAGGETSSTATQNDANSAAGIKTAIPITNKRIIVACQTGTDLSIGVGLAIACLLFDSDGHPLPSTSPSTQSTPPRREATTMTKDFVHRRLTWFSTSLPHANPARGTLQSVNSFLMDHRRD